MAVKGRRVTLVGQPRQPQIGVVQPALQPLRRRLMQQRCCGLKLGQQHAMQPVMWAQQPMELVRAQSCSVQRRLLEQE